MCSYMRVCVCVRMCVREKVRMYARARVCVCVRVYACVCAHSEPSDTMHAYVYVPVCMQERDS